jgi:pimeloyl-ACP methyl ester carboxylesterase
VSATGWREGRVRLAGGLSLAVCRWGPDPSASGPPAVVVVHGFLEQAAAWDTVAQGLVAALGRPVVAADLRGHGLSDWAGPDSHYAPWDYVADLAAVVAQLPGPPPDVLGHSLGGTTASRLAGTAPGSLRRLVLVEGLGMPDTREAFAHRTERFLAGRAQAPRHGQFDDPAEAAARMRSYNPGITEPAALALARRALRPVAAGDAHVTDPVAGRWTWTWDPRHRARNPDVFDAALHRELLGRVRAPTLLVDGGASAFVLPDDERAARVAALRSHAHVEEVTVPGAGHLVHHDAPDALVSAVARFLA